jgi:hypothetical protein
MPTRLPWAIAFFSAILWAWPAATAEPPPPVVQAEEVIQPDPPGVVVQADPDGPVLEEPSLQPMAGPMLGSEDGGWAEPCTGQPGCMCPLHGPPGCRPLARRIFGEFLYLRPGNEGVLYALPVDPIAGPPVGRISNADVDFHGGFRAGFSRRFTPLTDLTVTYTYFDGTDQNSLAAPNANLAVSSMVTMAGAGGPNNFRDALAELNVRFHMVDLDYRRIVFWDRFSTVRWLAGIRYAHLEQDFASRFNTATNTEKVDTSIGFDGGGLRVGVEAERHNAFGWFVFGRGAASFVGGQFQADYVDKYQNNRVELGWTEDRIVSMLDLELGIGWSGPGDFLRLQAGYMVSAWFDPLTTGPFIRSLQTNGVTDAHNSLTFDGFFARAELRF